MRRLSLLIAGVLTCILLSAATKSDTMDDNKWNWTEWADQYSSLSFEDGYMVITYKKAPKLSKSEKKVRQDVVKLFVTHSKEIQSLTANGDVAELNKFYAEHGVDMTTVGTIFSGSYKVRTFAKLPISIEDNYKVTIKYLAPTGLFSNYKILFNGKKSCLEEDEDSQKECRSDCVAFSGQQVIVQYTTASGISNFSMDFPVKITKEMPMELTIEKKTSKILIELNGIQLYKGEGHITEPCIGFQLASPACTLKIDEVRVDYVEREDD